MAEKDVQDYLTKGMYGNRITNPEERKAFLGSLRERTTLYMSKKEVLSLKWLDALKKEMDLYPNNHLLLNGDLSITQLTPYMKLANENNISFTIINHPNKDDVDVGLVFASKQAVHEEKIDVYEKYPLKVDDHCEIQKKKSFFEHFLKK